MNMQQFFAFTSLCPIIIYISANDFGTLVPFLSIDRFCSQRKIGNEKKLKEKHPSQPLRITFTNLDR